MSLGTGAERLAGSRNHKPKGRSGLSIGFEVDGDILKVDSYGGQGPHTSEGSGGS